MSSWEGVPEIVCHDATPTQIGQVHGRIAADRIRTSIKNYTNLYRETANLTWEESRARAEKYIEPLTRSVPEIVEEMKAIALASDVPFIDILTLNVRSEISLTNYSDGCTTVGQYWKPKDGGQESVFLAQNWDWVGETANATVFFDIQPQGKPRIRMYGEAGLVGKFGFNSAGVAVCMNAIRSGFVDCEKLPVHVAIRKLLECSSFAEAKQLLKEKGLASCVHFAVADSTGKLASFECSPIGNTEIEADDEGTICHTNHLYAKNLPPKLVDHPSKNSFSRLERMQELTQGQPPSFSSIRSRMSDEQNAPVAICRSAPPGASGMERMETLSTIIVNLKERTAEISLGRPSLSPPIRILTV